MLILKQSTAVDVLIGPFLSKTDAYTAEVGETPSVKVSKNGQALAAKNDITVPVHDADGYYNCELDATDTDTVGHLVLIVPVSTNALPVRMEYQVVEEGVYDYLYALNAVGTRIHRTLSSVVLGVCTTGGSITSIVVSSLDPVSSVNDQFKGRIMNFDKDTTTAALRGQSTDITAFSHATQTFTVTALTTAPVSGDTFSIT